MFVLQGFLLWIISASLLAIHSMGSNLIWLDIFAILVWLVGFFFEVVGELQLTIFKSNSANKGKLFTRSLWKYTRHANYFGYAAL